MSDKLDIILLNKLNNIIEETSIKRPKTYQDLLLVLKNKLAKLPENFKIFYNFQGDSENIINSNEKYLLADNILFIKETENDILDQSIFSLNYNELSEKDKEILDEQYNCLLCTQIIKNQNPYFCYSCQKVYHIKCLEEWDRKRRINNKNLDCPFCRKELPLEKWQRKLDFQEKRNKDAEIMNKLNKYEKTMNNNKIKQYEKYIIKTCIFIQNILNKINEINSFIGENNTNNLNKLIKKISFNYIVSSIDAISTTVMIELGKIEKIFNKKLKIETEQKNIFENRIKKLNDEINEIQERYLYINDEQKKVLSLFHPKIIINELNKLEDEFKNIITDNNTHSKLINNFLRKLAIYSDTYMRKGLKEKPLDEIEKDLDEIVNASKYKNPKLDYILNLKSNFIKRLIDSQSNISME